MGAKYSEEDSCRGAAKPGTSSRLKIAEGYVPGWFMSKLSGKDMPSREPSLFALATASAALRDELAVAK
jgi:hypothetical protein